MIVCDHCGAEVFWSFPRPDDLCFECNKPIQKPIDDPQFRTTSRGFDGFLPMKTSYGHAIEVSESSAVNPSIWMRVDGTGNSCSDPEVMLSVHMRIDQARKLRDRLTYLIDHHYGLEE